MSDAGVSNPSGHIFRVDKFVVPLAARTEFLSKVRATHERLRTVPGFVQDDILEQTSGPGEFNFVTFVAWISDDCIAAAPAAVMDLHRQMGFNPQAMYAQLGIKADVGTYTRVG